MTAGGGRGILGRGEGAARGEGTVGGEGVKSVAKGQSIEEKECSYGKSKSSIIWPKCPLDVMARVKSY